MSMKLSPIAFCSIRTSPGPGFGVSTSSHRRTSGPPVSNILIALAIGSASLASQLRQSLHDAANAEKIHAGHTDADPHEFMRVHVLQERDDTEHTPCEEHREVDRP